MKRERQTHDTHTEREREEEARVKYGGTNFYEKALGGVVLQWICHTEPCNLIIVWPVRRADRQTRQAGIFHTAQSQAPYPLSQHIGLAGAFTMSKAYDLWYSNTAHPKNGTDRGGERSERTGKKKDWGKAGGMLQLLILNNNCKSLVCGGGELDHHKGRFRHTLASRRTEGENIEDITFSSARKFPPACIHVLCVCVCPYLHLMHMHDC